MPAFPDEKGNGTTIVLQMVYVIHEIPPKLRRKSVSPTLVLKLLVPCTCTWYAIYGTGTW